MPTSESWGWGKPLCTPLGAFTVLDPILKAQGEKKKRQARMTEGKRTITVTVRQADEVPEHLTCAYMMTPDGLRAVEWHHPVPGYVAGWLSRDLLRPIDRLGYWFTYDDILQAVEGGKNE